jgi:hypothetical protein
MGNQEQSQPLLSDDNHHHKSSFTPYHDDSGSETVSSTTVYTPSTSEVETLGDALPEYHDVTPAYTPPSVGDYKGGDVAGIPVEQEDDEETDEPVRRRGRCCGRFRKSKKSDKKRPLRRRLFVLLKIILLVSLVSFFIGKKCMRHKKVGRARKKDMFESHLHHQNRSRTLCG